MRAFSRLVSQGGCRQFKQIDGDTVAHDHLTWGCAGEGGDLFAYSSGSFPPTFTPTLDQIVTPFVFGDLLGSVQLLSKTSCRGNCRPGISCQDRR